MLFVWTHFVSPCCKTWLLRVGDCDARRLPLNWLRSILVGRACALPPAEDKLIHIQYTACILQVQSLLQRINLYRRTPSAEDKLILIQASANTLLLLLHLLPDCTLSQMCKLFRTHITLHTTTCRSICEEHTIRESLCRIGKDICSMKYCDVRSYSILTIGKNFLLTRSLCTITSSEYNFHIRLRSLWLCRWAWCNYNFRKQPTDAQTFISTVGETL